MRVSTSILKTATFIFVSLFAETLSAQTLGDTLAYDTFTDSDGALLTSHTLNTGQTWLAEQSPNVKILSNQAEAYAGGASTSAYYYYVILSQTSNYRIKMRWQDKDAAPSGDMFYIIFRAVDTDSNYYTIYDGTLGQFRIGLRAGVSGGTLRSSSYTHDTSIWYRTEVECTGDTIRAWLYDDDQDTLIVTLSDTINSVVQGTRIGLNVYGGNLANEHVDDFVAIDILTAAVRRRGAARNVVW